mgnify:CR=1 FL=1
MIYTKEQALKYGLSKKKRNLPIENVDMGNNDDDEFGEMFNNVLKEVMNEKMGQKMSDKMSQKMSDYLLRILSKVSFTNCWVTGPL